MRGKVFFVMLVACLIVLSHGKHKKKKREFKKNMDHEGMVHDLQMLQANVTNLWKEVRSMKHGTEEGVSVSFTGVEGEEMTASHDSTGTHVHVHMHIDSMQPGMKKKMGGKHGMHGMKGMHAPDCPWKVHDGTNKENIDYTKKHHMHHLDPETYMYAQCNVKSNPTLLDTFTDRVTGTVYFRQKVRKPLEVLVNLKGFDTSRTDKLHGFHVHQFADDTSGCESYGGHFNPDNMKHGGPTDTVRHAGDWGNLLQDSNGEVKKNFTDNLTHLIGPHSILGRGLVIHVHNDDLGRGTHPSSNMTGNAGGRLGCCVVFWSADTDWKTLSLPADSN